MVLPSFIVRCASKRERDRIPTLHELERDATKENNAEDLRLINVAIDSNKAFILHQKTNENDLRIPKKDNNFYRYILMYVLLSFLLGVLIGIVITGSIQNDSQRSRRAKNETGHQGRNLNSFKIEAETKILVRDFDEDLKKHHFQAVSFQKLVTGKPDRKYNNKDIYPKSLTEDMKDILKDNKVKDHKNLLNSVLIVKNLTDLAYHPNSHTVLFDNIFWGPEIEDNMPQGYGINSGELFEKYVEQTEVVKMEVGCGRMLNRLVIFKDGSHACVRYRQNTDQIQGEIFSYYVGKLLNLTNLAPSVVKIVDVKDKLWKHVATDVANAQWSTNRAVVLTQYIPNLESATIPEVFKPKTRHLSKNDVLKLSLKENGDSKEVIIDKIKGKSVKTNNKITNFDHIDMKLNKNTVRSFVELAQWSDLIIFDYLTANLDRIVNNLFNFQWNINIMDGPAHNLAKKMDSGLLMFLDNESGLLHGYRLLKKYNVYHSLMLDNLCVFRKTTVNALKELYRSGDVGRKITDMFHSKNNAVIRDILPTLPDKNAKILHDRIGNVLSQIEKCEQMFLN